MIKRSQGRKHDVDSGVGATNVGDGMDMDVESGDNSVDYVVADHEGNEVVLDTVTQE